MFPAEPNVKVNLTMDSSTISNGAAAIVEEMPERRAGRPSIPDEFAETLWSHIEATHKRLGSVVRKTARHYGTTATTVSNWLSRTSKPSFGVMADVARIDGIPLDRLMFGANVARPLLNIIDAIFQTHPAVGQEDPVAMRANMAALTEAAHRLGGDQTEHEDALAICRTLLKAGRVDNADGWALLLARIEELDIAPALLTSDSDLTWHTGIDFARQRPPPDRLPDEVTEPAAKPVAELRVSRNTVSVGGARKKTR